VGTRSTTSQLLTTGVDAPTCKNIVIARAIGSMTEFKQIIGRGTRLRNDYGRLWFTILDYTGSATQNLTGAVGTIGPNQMTELSLNSDGLIIRPDGRVVPVLHQHDRHPELKTRSIYYIAPKDQKLASSA
jgi:type I restriction enzyme R subunit